LIDIHEVLVASNNPGKIREIKHALGKRIPRLRSLKEAGIKLSPREEGTSYLENALIKAKAAAECWDGWILSDDSGLEVDLLGGQPGLYSSRFAGEKATDEDNNRKLLELLGNIPEQARTARFRCVVVLYHRDQPPLTTEGVCEGVITSTPRGLNGFGYDPLFYLPSKQRTMAELSFEEKMQLSHRAHALKKLKQWLLQPPL